MNKFFGRTILSLAIIATMLGSASATAFAAESDVTANPSAAYSASADDASDQGKVTPTRGDYGVYTYTDTLVYTGIGSDRWLHITPWLTPNRLTIKMVDYSGTTVWNETFDTTGTTHWFVGSNVQYVYLRGLPGGTVTVTNTAN